MLLALVRPPRLGSMSNVSRSPRVRFSGSIPTECRALICMNTSGPPESSFDKTEATICLPHLQCPSSQSRSVSPSLSAPALQAGGWPCTVIRCPSWREESSRRGSGGIWGRGTGGSESGLVAACLLRVNTRPREPIAIEIAPAIISQYGNLIDESRSIYFLFAFSPSSTTARKGFRPRPRFPEAWALIQGLPKFSRGHLSVNF